MLETIDNIVLSAPKKPVIPFALSLSYDRLTSCNKPRETNPGISEG
jgi:hypothetical protein